MAELVATIIGISGAALKLSTGLYKVASALKNAGQEVRIIANDTAQFSRSLKELSHTLESDVPAMTRARNVAEDVIATCLSIQEDGEKLLEILKPLVEQSERVFSRVFLSVRWLFERSKFAYHRELLSSLKSTLQLLVSVIMLETMPDRDMLSHLVEEVVNLRHTVQSGMHSMEQHLQSPQLMETLQPRTGSFPNPGSDVSLLAIEGPSNTGTEMTVSDRSETTPADETSSSPSSSAIAVRGEDWELESFQDAVEETASPATGHVGPLALLPYFRAYLAQGKVCQYMDEALRLMDYDQDGNLIDGHPDLLGTASATIPSSSTRENPIHMTSVLESSVEIAADIDQSQSIIDAPQNKAKNPLFIRPDLATDRQAEVEEETPIVELQPASEPTPQQPIEDERVNPQLEIARNGSRSVLGSSLSQSDGIVTGAQSLSRTPSQAEREVESAIQQGPSLTPFNLSSMGVNVPNSGSDVPERPPATISPQSKDGIPHETDPEVVYFWGHTNEFTPIPFQRCRTYEGLVEAVKLYGFGSKIKSPFWRAAALSRIGRMYQDSLTSNSSFLRRKSIFDKKFKQVWPGNWRRLARPDTVIKIHFDQDELRQLFDSPKSESIPAIEALHALRAKELKNQKEYDREFQNQQEEVVPQAQEVQDKERHGGESRNQQEEARATTIMKLEENRPSAQSKLGKRINFLRRH